ncbi:NACHT domain-containing protein [Streptomyces sp. NPDC002324]
MTANQVLSEGKLSWTWLYVSYAVAVVSLLYAELGPASPATDPAPRGRRRVYLRQLRASVRDMEIVGIATQSEFVFRMRQVYVDVSVAPQPLHDAAREPYLGSMAVGERRTLASVLRDAERNERSRTLAVIGGPGSGKTTLARYTALELCGHRWRPWKRRLPVLLYLRDHAAALLADDPPELAAVAVSADWLSGKVSADWLTRKLDQGRCVVLLDGLDEVADPAERIRVVNWVAGRIQRHPDNTYVVTSRHHGYESNPLPNAEVLQVRRFTWQQIEQFLRQWSFATESRARQGTPQEIQVHADGSADELLSRLRKQPALYDLAANPLLLTMTANVHRYRDQLPGSRAELYAEMCDVLLHRRAEARRMHDATGLTGPHKQQVAQHLALAMMRAEDRYWPVSEAAEAIRGPLQQIPGDVAADLFLTEARKSGLLVEREHGVYGFAHLTLQEYLAAAQLSTPGADTALLTSNVDVSWWRETILLWSAGNNATPIVAACLANGTVPALALAFDCAAQAQVAPAVRERLEAELAPPVPGEATDPARQRLRTGVLATRTFREAIPVDETTALCTHAVPRSLYDLFVREEEAEGRHHPPFITDTGSDEERQRPAKGIRIGDAERFVVWLNAVTGDPVYRLPSLEELRQPAAAGATALQEHTVWAHDGSSTVLHQPPGVHWPYTSSPEQLRSIAVADREQLMLYLRFMGIPAAQSRSVEAWAAALTTALQHVPARRSHPDFASLELALILSLAFTLDLTRTHALATDLAPYGALARSLGIDFDPTHDLVFDRTRERARVLDHALDRTLGRARTLAPDLARDRDLSLDPDLALARDLARARAHASALAQNPVFRHGPRPDPELDLFDPGLNPRPAPDPDLALAITEALGLHPDQALNPDYAPAFALPLALARTHESHIDVQRLALASFRTLFSTYRPRRRVRATGSVLAELDTVLTRTAEGCPWERRPPEDPARLVREALTLLQTTQRTDDGRRLSSVLALVHDTAGLLTTIRNRRVPSDTLVLSSARTALIAAITALHATGLPTREPVRLLHSAWQSLVSDAITPPSQRTTDNQILLLVRTQP